MTTLVLNDLTSLANETSAVTAINTNSNATETAVHASLPKDGSEPMGGNLDMNSNRVINLPLPVADTEPVRKGEFDDLSDAIADDVADAEAAAVAAAASASAASTDAGTASSAASAASASAAAAAASAASVAGLAAGTIIPTAMTAAAWQTAFNTAVTNGYNGTGPTHVALLSPGLHRPTAVTHASAATAGVAAFGTEVPNFKLTIGPGVRIKKDAAWVHATHLALFAFWYCNRLQIDCFGELIGLGQEASWVPGTVNPAGDDGIRMWSCQRVILNYAKVSWFGDSALRFATTSSDADPEGATDLFLNFCDMQNCGQFSSTNTTGGLLSFRRLFVNGGYFYRMNSFKNASRGTGTEIAWFHNCYIDVGGGSACLEMDGPSKIYIQDCILRGANQNSNSSAISIISNNSLGGTAHGFTDIKITGTIIEDSTRGVRLEPDNQDNNFVYTPVRNVFMDFVFKGGSVANSSRALTMNGSMSNVRARVSVVDFDGAQVVYCTGMRESDNIEIEVTGNSVHNNTGDSSHVIWFERGTTGSLPNTTMNRDIKFKVNNFSVLGMSRVFYIDGIDGLHVSGKVSGAFAASMFIGNTQGGLANVTFDGWETNLTTSSNAINLANTLGGVIRNCKLNAAGSQPISIGSTCSGVIVDQDSVVCLNAGAPITTGDGSGVSNSQFRVTTASRSGDVVTVTVAHGSSTDFTPSSGITGFRYYNATTGVEIPQASCVRTNATTITLTLSTGLGAAGTLWFTPRVTPGVGAHTKASFPRDNSAAPGVLHSGLPYTLAVA